MKKKLSGAQVIVPMISPFKADYSIDKAAVGRMCGMFVNAGVSVFVMGTTGEGDSLSQNQRDTLVQLVVREINGRSKIYAGLTGNSLTESINDARKYADMGADYLVGKIPSYYPIDYNQMLRYLDQLADSVSLPLFIYNIPATTHHSIPLSIIDKLSYHPNIFGLKDSERSLERFDQAITLWGERDDFDLLIGWAAMSVYGLLKGAKGIVPSTGNLCPELYVQMVDAVVEGNEKRAFDIQEKIEKISFLYQEDRSLSQSIPALKSIMRIKGLCSGEVLPPMISMSLLEEEIFTSEVRNEWIKLNLL